MTASLDRDSVTNHKEIPAQGGNDRPSGNDRPGRNDIKRPKNSVKIRISEFFCSKTPQKVPSSTPKDLRLGRTIAGSTPLIP